MRCKAFRAALRLVKATRNLRGTDGSGPTTRSSFATKARHPESEPGRKLLDQIGKEHRATHDVEEDDLRRDEIVLHHDLIDLSCPIRTGHVSEVGIKGDIVTFPAQTRRGRACRRGRHVSTPEETSGAAN